MIGFLIALVSGALMSIQGVFNTQVTKSTGIWTASAFYSIAGMSGGMAVYGADFILEDSAGGAQIYAFGRGHRSLYHLHCDPQYGCPGTGQSGNAYCGRSACCSIYYRTVRMVRCGEAALGVAESHRHGRGDCGYCDFQVEMIQSYPRSGNFAKGF